MHGDGSIQIERDNMYCLGIACSRSFYICLTSSECQKLEYFRCKSNRVYKRDNMYCEGIACYRSFYMCLTSTECQKLECFRYTSNTVYK